MNGTTKKAAAAIGLIMALAAGSASAQATRTWVSGVGDDANPCSRTAPCKTWAGAISKTAAGGIINSMDPGGYGALTITKSITIEGSAGVMSSVLATGTNGIVINAGPNDLVVLRNLHLDGQQSGVSSTAGVKLIAGGFLVVENVDIQRFGTGIDIPASAEGAHVHIRKTTLTGNTNGVRSGSNRGSVMVSDSVLRGNGTGAIANAGVVGLDRATLIHNTHAVDKSGNGQLHTYNNNLFFGNGSDGAGKLTDKQLK